MFSWVEVKGRQDSPQKAFVSMIAESEAIRDCILNFASQKPKVKTLEEYGEDMIASLKLIIKQIIDFKCPFKAVKITTKTGKNA